MSKNRINRLLAVTLTFTMINLTLAQVALAAGSPTRTAARNTMPRSVPATPPGQGGPNRVTKATIKQDLDDLKASVERIKGTGKSNRSKVNNFATNLIDKSGLEPEDLIDEAKAQVDSLTDDQFAALQDQFEKVHNRVSKRKKHVDDLFPDDLLTWLHSIPATKAHSFAIKGVGAGGLASGNAPGLSGSIKGMDKKQLLGRYAPSISAFKNSAANGSAFFIVPETNPDTCDPGSGTPLGISDVMIGKGVSLAADIVREYIPEDLTSIIPATVATTAWAVAAAAELVLEALHSVYSECNNAKDQQRVEGKIDGLVSDQTTAINTLTNISSNVSTVSSSIGTPSGTTIAGDTANIRSVVNNGFNFIDDRELEALRSNIASNLTNAQTAIVNNDNTNRNTIIANNNAIAATISNNIGNAQTNIVNNNNANKDEMRNLLLRLQIEADLASGDNATPVALFVSPATPNCDASAGSPVNQCGLLDLVQKIVAQTIARIAGTATARATSFLDAGDASKKAGDYKTAYQQYRQAYKMAISKGGH